MSNEANVVVAGHICLDIILKVATDSRTVGDIFRPGKLMHVEEATVSSGGCVSNTGLALNRLGVGVKLMGKCGNDIFGSALIQKIRNEANGAEAGMQVVDNETTSYTVVISSPNIDRIFFHCCGANDTFTAEDINIKTVEQAELLHFGYPPLMAQTYKNDGEELAKIFAKAKSAGTTTSLDLALPDPANLSGQVDWTKILNRTLPDVDLFLPSVEELTFMLRQEYFNNILACTGNNDFLGQISGELLNELAEQCIKAGAAIVLLKCGRLGMYVRTAGRERLEKMGRARPKDFNNWADREIFEPSYHVDKVISAVGSGDNSIAGFLAAFLRGCPLEDALQYACAVGAQNVQVPDAVSGVKDWEETSQQIRSGLKKNKTIITLKGR